MTVLPETFTAWLVGPLGRRIGAVTLTNPPPATVTYGGNLYSWDGTNYRRGSRPTGPRRVTFFDLVGPGGVEVADVLVACDAAKEKGLGETPVEKLPPKKRCHVHGIPREPYGKALAACLPRIEAKFSDGAALSYCLFEKDAVKFVLKFLGVTAPSRHYVIARNGPWPLGSCRHCGDPAPGRIVCETCSGVVTVLRNSGVGK